MYFKNIKLALFIFFIGLVHSGWKGTSESIILSAISIFSNYGSTEKDIKIYLGPSIKSCCYEIKNDVAKYFDQKFIMYSTPTNINFLIQ